MEIKGNKLPKIISKKSILIMFGLSLLLLVFVLILDIGYVAKTINFLPIYLFGYTTFVIYSLMFMVGVYYVFFYKDKTIKLNFYRIFSLLLCLISISGFLTLLMCDESFNIDNFTNVINSKFDSYYDPYNIPFLFRMSKGNTGGGFLGYLVCSLFYSLNLEAAFLYVIFVLLFLIGLAILFSPFIKNLIKRSKNKKRIKKEELHKKFANYSFEDLEREARIADPETYLDKTQAIRDQMNDESYFVKQEQNSNQINTIEKDENISPIKENDVEDIIDESVLNEQLVNKTKDESTSFENKKTFVKEEYFMKKEPVNNKIYDYSKENIKKASSFSNEDYPTTDPKKSPFYKEVEPNIPCYDPDNERIGGLTKAHYFKDGVKRVVEQPSKKVYENASVETEIRKTVAQEVSSKEEVKKVEQMTLDFDAKEEIVLDDNIISAKPIFLDPNEQDVKKDVIVNKPINTSVNNKPKKERRPWIPIDLSLLIEYEAGEAKEQNELTAKQRMHKINEIFNAFRVQAHCSDYTVGPSVTRYNIECGQGVSVKSVSGVINDLSVRLGGVDARFVPIVMGKAYSGLEIQNAVITTVGYKEVLEKLPSRDKKPLAVAFGKDIAGEIVWGSLDDFPHMLISGTTGSGKSIFIHSIIMTLIMRTSPDDLKIVLVDPKQVEMTKYADMPHLLCPIITEPNDANEVMKKLVDEMDENRYRLFRETGCSDIKQYNEYCIDHPDYEPLPYIVAILDEYSDLVERCKDIARPVLSLAQKARAAGIHILVCTQRPSTNVINGVIKGNLPTHVALMTANSFDSMTIIGEGGAEKLLGKGDMLVQSPIVSRVGCVRLQGCFVQNKEIGKIVDFLKQNYKTIYDPAYLDLGEQNKEQNNPFSATADKNFHDEKYEYVKSIIMGQEYASISKIVREFGFGFTRAGKIFLQLQKEGIVDTNGNASKGCKVLVHDESYGVTPELNSIEATTVERISSDTNLLPDEDIDNYE